MLSQNLMWNYMSWNFNWFQSQDTTVQESTWRFKKLFGFQTVDFLLWASSYGTATIDVLLIVCKRAHVFRTSGRCFSTDSYFVMAWKLVWELLSNCWSECFMGWSPNTPPSSFVAVLKVLVTFLRLIGLSSSFWCFDFFVLSVFDWCCAGSLPSFTFTPILSSRHQLFFICRLMEMWNSQRYTCISFYNMTHFINFKLFLDPWLAFEDCIYLQNQVGMPVVLFP